MLLPSLAGEPTTGEPNRFEPQFALPSPAQRLWSAALLPLEPATVTTPVETKVVIDGAAVAPPVPAAKVQATDPPLPLKA